MKLKKSIKKFSVLTLVTLMTITSFTSVASACTSVFAGKDATVDGSVIIARNEDMSSAWSKHFKVFERQEHKEGETLKFYNGLEIPQPKVSYKYMALPDWDNSEGPYEEAGINEYGVAISATNSAYVNEKVKQVDPFVDNGIGESHIPTLILPRAKTSREGIMLLGSFIEKYGAMEGNGLAIADKNEVWYMEIGSGHRWVAVRVPDDKYVVVANQLRIGKVDLKDTKNYLGSSDIESFARENGLIGKNEEFDFAKAYGDLGKKYNTRREWWAQHLLTPSVKQSGEEKRYPLFMKPDKKLSVKDVMNVLRSRYEGTKYNPDSVTGKDERAIGVDRTMESHIIQLRQDMPVEISGLMWLSMGNPEYGVYVPFYAGITETPKSYQIGKNEYDSNSAYWAFRGAAALAETDKEKLGKGLKDYWNKYENNLIEIQSDIDKFVLELYKKDKEKALEFINMISNQIGEDAVDKAKALRQRLITTIAENNDEVFNPDL